MAKNKLPTIISFILDRSGSMETIRGSVISGFNEYINGLKLGKDTKKALFSLTTFDTDGIDTPYVLTPVSLVKDLTKKTFVPRSGTPLYDAVVNAVEKLSDSVEPNQPVIVAIMTDGEENSSREHTQECMRDLVQELKKKGNYTFVFMGANQDSWSNARNLGFDMGNVVDFAASELGTKNVMRSFGNATAMLCSAMAEAPVGAAMNSANFFNQNDAQSLTPTPKLSK